MPRPRTIPGTGSWSGTRRSFPRPIRQRILARDGACVRCGDHATIADHIIPISEGGTDDEDNGQALCELCHTIKTHEEQQRGRARHARQRPPEPHPGLI